MILHIIQSQKIIEALGISNTANAEIVRRIDLPDKYQLQFYNFSLGGMINTIEALTFIDAELTSHLKINAYTNLATINTDYMASYMVLMLLKMSPKDPLPLTRLFYPDYKLVYYRTEGPMYDASYAWKNDKIIWVYKLRKLLLFGENGSEQKIEIFQIFLPDQKLRKTGELGLGGLKAQLDAKFAVYKHFLNMTCRSIEIFSRHRGMLGCTLFNETLLFDPSKTQIHIIIEIKKDRKRRYLKIEDIVAEKKINGENLVAKCVVNFLHTEKSRSNEKYLVKPFVMVYHVPGSGYFMRSSTEEWLQIIDDQDLSSGMKLTNTICQTESKAFILRYQKELKEKKRFRNEAGLKTWSKVVLMVLNLDSKVKADSRIITKIEREVPFALNTEQVFQAFYIEKNNTLVIGNTGKLANYRRLFYSTLIDMKYPRITISTNSSEDFTAEMKIFLDYQSATTEGAYGFPFKIDAKTPKKFEMRTLNNTSLLKNQQYNLEEFLRITGPMNSIQQIPDPKNRIKFISRLFWYQTIIPDAEYIHMRWISKDIFLGITKKKFLFVANGKHDTKVSYSQTVRSAIYSCCSNTTSFYILHYDPNLVNSLSVRVMDVVQSKTNKNMKTLKNYPLSYIDSMMIPHIHVPSSEQFLKSVADGTIALCLHDRHLVKIVMIDYIDKDSPVVTPVPSISSKSIGRETEFSKIEIISMMTETPELRALMVVLGTTSQIVTQYVHYNPSIKNLELKTLPTNWQDPGLITTLNASLDYIRCENAIVTKYKEGPTRVSSRCSVVFSNYLMKSLVIEAEISHLSSYGGQGYYFLSTPSCSFAHEYEIPRFFEVISVKVSRDYLAVHALSTLDYHNEILVYKRGRREVWSSAYSSYGGTVSYGLGLWKKTSSWLYVNEFGTALKVYLIGNMTMEVEEGYDVSESLRLAYSTFGRPREVESYIQEFKFSENLVRKSNLFLFIYGSVGGFFGVIIFLWCCCCIFRCVYIRFIKKFHKREKKMVPILIKKRTQ